MDLSSIWTKKKKEEPKPEVKEAPKTVVIASSGVIPVASTNYMEHLDGAMRKNNPIGLDYLEFSDAIKALASQPLDEKQKFVVTFPSYVATGVTVDKLIASAGSYLSVIQKVKNDFVTQLANETQASVDDKLHDCDLLQKDIQSLTKQIQEKTATMQKLSTEAADAKNKLQSEEIAFNNAYNSKKEEITNNITKIQTYLDATTK